MDVQSFLSWAAPILSTLIICAGQLALNAKFKHADEKRDKDRTDADAARAADKEWRDDIVAQLNSQDKKIDTMLDVQCTQIRSDIIHRAHRYMDDLGCASVEEKDSFWDEYTHYQRLCKASNVENGFIDDMVQKVMNLLFD